MLMQANSSLIQPSWTSQQIPVLITQDSSEAVRDLPQSIILTALSCLPPLLGLLTGSGFAAVLSAYVWNKLFTSNLILVLCGNTLRICFQTPYMCSMFSPYQGLQLF